MDNKTSPGIARCSLCRWRRCCKWRRHRRRRRFKLKVDVVKDVVSDVKVDVVVASVVVVIVEDVVSDLKVDLDDELSTSGFRIRFLSPSNPGNCIHPSLVALPISSSIFRNAKNKSTTNGETDFRTFGCILVPASSTLNDEFCHPILIVSLWGHLIVHIRQTR